MPYDLRFTAIHHICYQLYNKSTNHFFSNYNYNPLISKCLNKTNFC